ncbi:hypothetical protein [Deinococcus sp.]|uniref:hypothetical protein n=1 Tax=Deinococcus sp. TaxID=47478 RepID=UPI0025E8794C|nr:hypothetical protein [Deinococcus sp.]
MREHELWREDFGTHTEYTLCLAGPAGEAARASLGPSATRIWTVRAASYVNAMQQYYDFMDWGDCSVVGCPVAHETDREPCATAAPTAFGNATGDNKT